MLHILHFLLSMSSHDLIGTPGCDGVFLHLIFTSILLPITCSRYIYIFLRDIPSYNSDQFVHILLCLRPFIKLFIDSCLLSSCWVYFLILRLSLIYCPNWHLNGLTYHGLDYQIALILITCILSQINKKFS